MIDKVYLVLGHDDGNSGGWGDYVSLYGIYTDENEANKRELELDKGLKEIGKTRETFEVKEVRFNQNVSEFLGGYAE